MTVCRSRGCGPIRRRSGSNLAADTGVVEKRWELLAVGAHEALDEVLDVARLGQAPAGKLIRQLGLGQTLVGFAGLQLGLLGFFPLDALGFAGLGLFGLFGFVGFLLSLLGFFPLDALGFAGLGLLGLVVLLLGGLLGLLRLLHGQVRDLIGLVLHDASELLRLLPDGAGQAAERFGPLGCQLPVEVDRLLQVLEVPG